jgi:hypothetical protein
MQHFERLCKRDGEVAGDFLQRHHYDDRRRSRIPRAGTGRFGAGDRLICRTGIYTSWT